MEVEARSRRSEMEERSRIVEAAARERRLEMEERFRRAEVEAEARSRRVEMEARERRGEVELRSRIVEAEARSRRVEVEAGSRRMARLEVLQATVEEMVRGEEGRREALECPVCTEEMLPLKQVLQCSSGHPVCSTCRPRVARCPTCRGPITGRNIGMEALIRMM